MADSVMRDVRVDSNIIDVDIYARGRGVTSTETSYLIGDSSTTAPSGTWSTTIPTITTADQGKYLWTKITSTYSDNTIYESYSVVYIAHDGGYYTPSVNSSGVLSWTKSSTILPDASSVNIAQTTANLISFRATEDKQSGKLVEYSTDNELTWNSMSAVLPTSADPDIMKASVYVGNNATGSVHNADYTNGFTLGKNVPADAALTDTTYTNGTGLVLTGTSFSLATSGAAAGTYGPSASSSTSLSNTNNNILVPDITVDTYGRITSISTKKYEDVDTKVQQVYTTSSEGNYPLLFKSAAGTSGTTNVLATSAFNNQLYVQPGTGSYYGQHYYKQVIENNTTVNKELGYGNILYGTSEPTANDGEIGDVYLQYTA